MTTTLASPQYAHDCRSCRFLGRSADGKADLYCCGNPKDQHCTLIARYSNYGPDYSSIHRNGADRWRAEKHKPAHPTLLEALQMVRRLNNEPVTFDIFNRFSRTWMGCYAGATPDEALRARAMVLGPNRDVLYAEDTVMVCSDGSRWVYRDGAWMKQPPVE